MESNHLGSSSAEYGACRINGDTLVLTPFVYSSTFLYLTDYIRENTNLDDEQIEKELDLLGENNSSDTVRSLYNEWCSLRFKPIDVPVFRSKKESINLCLDPDKFSEYRYIMKGRKLINITAKEIKYRQHNILLQDLYKVDLPIPPEKEVFRKLLDKYNQNYDYIVVDSDDTGILAEYCAGTVIIQDVKKYSIDDTNALVKKLEQNGCNVSGVIMRE